MALDPVGDGDWSAGDWPLGASSAGGDIAFALHAPAAERVLLEVFDEAFGAPPRARCWMSSCPDGAWRARVAGLGHGSLYGYRAWGPNWRFDPAWKPGGSAAGFVADVDPAGNRFNPNKLLMDPYARELSHEKLCPRARAAGWDGSAYGSGERREVDTGPIAPKSVVVLDSSSFGKKPALPPQDAIIYEAHVRGLSAHPSASKLPEILAGCPGMEAVRAVPEELRGTYAGAAYLAPYLRALGFTAVEFLPVQETAAGPCPADGAGGNFWGYMTAAFFAPDRRYAFDASAGGPTREFKAMVRAFHEQELEVYLDVVYNHTAEGGAWDAARQAADVFSFRGLDNPGYYALVPGDKSAYWESTGCGNNLNAGSPVVQELVLDSLRYWLDEMGVDGFRFDLAPVLGRVHKEDYGFDPRGDLLVRIADLAASRGAEVIAESWDCSSGGYQVGNFPDRWAEWNGRYRDSVRRLMRGELDSSAAGGLSPADALHGDWLHFEDQGGPERSINFLDAHDGFTLADLVSYNLKSNDGPWPFGPSDGGNDSNGSWDSTWVPPASGCPDHRAFRRQRWRTMLCFLMMSRGVPMIVYGDELCRTQNGNNNPYNLDSVATWNNYASIRSDSPQAVPIGAVGAPDGARYHDNFGPDSKPDGFSACFRFVSFVTRLRRVSEALRQGSYGMGISYSRADGSPGYDSSADEAFTARIRGSAVGDRDFVLLVNLSFEAARFKVEEADPGTAWKRLVDTAWWAEEFDNVWNLSEATAIGGEYEAKACSIVVLAAS